GAGSANAAATLIGLERELRARLSAEDRLRIAAEVGSDVPLFLVGGLVLGHGRGEEVYALPDLPPLPLGVVTPEIAVSTPKAFADWDVLVEKLTDFAPTDTIKGFSHTVFAWLTGTPTGVSPAKGNRAEALLLDLVRAGIENDFERVVFPQHPEL